MPYASQLPMVCVPVPWTIETSTQKEVPNIGDLVGRYINPGTNMSPAMHLLSTKDAAHFYALFSLAVGKVTRGCVNHLHNFKVSGFRLTDM